MFENFPTYQKCLDIFERERLASKIGKWNGGCNCYNGWVDQKMGFDEDFVHKLFDGLGIPRVIDQPVDFTI